VEQAKITCRKCIGFRQGPHSHVICCSATDPWEFAKVSFKFVRVSDSSKRKFFVTHSAREVPQAVGASAWKSNGLQIGIGEDFWRREKMSETLRRK